MTPDQRTQRGSRLRAELLDEGIITPSGVLGDLLIDELVSARYVEVHEGIRPTYGALIVGDFPDQFEMKLPSEGITTNEIRALADGLKNFVCRSVLDPGALKVVSIPLVDEVDSVSLAMRTLGVVVQRHETGAITVVQPEEIWVNETFTWRKKPVARQRAIEVGRALNLTGVQPLALVVNLLEFAVHQLSPQGIGATLVVPIGPDVVSSTEGLSDPGGPPPFELSSTFSADLYLLKTFLRVVDGACVFSPDGMVERTQAKLAASETALSVIKPDGGTRHSSAKWFSYDHPEYVVIVVSADGPVSLWSDGRKVAELLEDPTDRLLQVALVVPEERAQLTTSIEIETCQRCQRSQEVALRGGALGPSVSIACIICGGPLFETTGIVSSVRVRKPWWE